MLPLSLTMTVVGFAIVVGTILIIRGLMTLLRGEFVGRTWYSSILLEPEENIKKAERTRNDARYDLNLINDTIVKPGCSAVEKCDIVAQNCHTEALRTLINGTCDEATAPRNLRGAGEGLRKIISDCEETIKRSQEVIRRRNQ